jgi:hypothetical protein
MPNNFGERAQQGPKDDSTEREVVPIVGRSLAESPNGTMLVSSRRRATDKEARAFLRRKKGGDRP